MELGSQFSLPILSVEQEGENVEQVISELSISCSACRLSLIHPVNRGLVWRGNPKAKIAIIGEAPGDEETETGRPFVGPSGRLWEQWTKRFEIDTRDGCFISNVLQCQPDKRRKTPHDREKSQMAPEASEIKACFKPRVLRVLRAMPNLEVVLTLGWVAASALTGTEAKAKTHEGKWFATSLLPGVGVFCLPHPSYLMRDPSDEKNEMFRQCLILFQREYLRLGKIIPLIQDAKNRL